MVGLLGLILVGLSGFGLGLLALLAAEDRDVGWEMAKALYQDVEAWKAAYERAAERSDGPLG